jgi:hypothetical protein
MRSLLLVVLSLAAVPTSAAQSPPLSGAWAVVGEGARGTAPDGSNWSLTPISGTLTLEQKGREVSGTWQGQMPEPWMVSGQIDDQSFELRSEWRDVSVGRDGTTSTARARWVFRGVVRRNTATGSMGFELEKGTPRGQPFNATRTP